MMPQSGSLLCFDNPEKRSEPEPTSQVSESSVPDKFPESIGATQAYGAGSVGVCQTAKALKKADPTKGRPTDESNPGDQTAGSQQKLDGNHDGDHETSSGGSIPHPELAQGVTEWDYKIKWWKVVSLRQKFDRTPDEILEALGVPLGIAGQYDAETFSGPESTCTDQTDWVHHIGPVKNLSQINWNFFQREAQKKEAQQEIDRLAKKQVTDQPKVDLQTEE